MNFNIRKGWLIGVYVKAGWNSDNNRIGYNNLTLDVFAIEDVKNPRNWYIGQVVGNGVSFVVGDNIIDTVRNVKENDEKKVVIKNENYVNFVIIIVEVHNVERAEMEALVRNEEGNFICKVGVGNADHGRNVVNGYIFINMPTFLNVMKGVDLDIDFSDVENEVV